MDLKLAAKRCREASQLEYQAKAAFVSPALPWPHWTLLHESPADILTFFPLYIILRDSCRGIKLFAGLLQMAGKFIWRCQQPRRMGLAGRAQVLLIVMLTGGKQKHHMAKHVASSPCVAPRCSVILESSGMTPGAVVNTLWKSKNHNQRGKA